MTTDQTVEMTSRESNTGNNRNDIVMIVKESHCLPGCRRTLHCCTSIMVMKEIRRLSAFRRILY